MLLTLRIGLVASVLFLLAPSVGALQTSAIEAFDCRQAGFEQAATPAATCGWIGVARDESAPGDGRSIKLAVAVAHATGPQHLDDPIVFLQGGPGVPIVGYTALLAHTAFAHDLESRDLLVIDQRGTGLSQPNLSCPEVQTFGRQALASASTNTEYAIGYFNALASCLERLRATDIDLSTFTSAQSAADILAVTKALGYSRINLYGLSYGARLALTIVRDFGDSGMIRSAALGGVYGPEANALQVPVGLAERLDLLFDACAADHDCNGQYGDLRRTLRDLLAELSAHPVPVSVTDPTSNATLPARADNTVLLEALLDALGTADGIAQVPARLAATHAGDTSLLVDGVRAQLQELDAAAWGMNAAVQCQEEFLLTSSDDQTAVAQAIRPGYEGLALRFPESSSGLPAWCADQAFASAPDYENAPVSSASVPVLAISGKYDPFTPPEWADRATAQLATRYLVTLPKAGHDSALSGTCPITIVSAFFADPTRSPDQRCVSE